MLIKILNIGGETIHKSNGGYEFWDEIKDDVIKKYIDDKRSSNDIAKDYNCYGTTVLSHLKRWGVPIRKSRYNSIYDLDTHFFDSIDSEEKAYVLGLIVADGHVSKKGVLMMTLKDYDGIEKYKSALKSSAKIRVDRNGNYQLNIRSIDLCNRLREIGLSNRKSYELDIDHVRSYIPESLEHHFVRGMFDGDGSIKYYSYPYLSGIQIHFGYTGLYNVVKYIMTYFDINTKIVKESDITYTCVSSCRETIARIFDVLYDSATIYIDRKYNTFLEIINMK